MDLATNLIFFVTIDRDRGRLTASPLPHQYEHLAMSVDVCFGSFATDPFSALADQCLLAQ
jgi:hypothetical protein